MDFFSRYLTNFCFRNRSMHKIWEFRFFHIGQRAYGGRGSWPVSWATVKRAPRFNNFAKSRNLSWGKPPDPQERFRLGTSGVLLKVSPFTSPHGSEINILHLLYVLYRSYVFTIYCSSCPHQVLPSKTDFVVEFRENQYRHEIGGKSCIQNPELDQSISVRKSSSISIIASKAQ